MQPFAIELSDRALAFARDGQVLSVEPSAVFDGSTGEPAGSQAWRAVRRYPAATSTQHLNALASQPEASSRAVALVAAELRQRLAAHAPRVGERVWLVAPAHVDVHGLGTLAGIARGTLNLPMDGVVDSAAVTIAGLGLGRDALVLELGLHHVAATAVDSDRVVRRRRAVSSARGGLMDLYTAWLDLISAAMVKQTRFDPLHDAATEQQLFDELPTLAEQAAVQGSAIAGVTVGNDRIEVSLTRDQFADAGQSVYREIFRLLHELRPAGASVALVVPAMTAALPGFRQELEHFVGCELIAIPDGFAAAATSMLDLPEAAGEEAVRFLRRLPVQGAIELAATAQRETLGQVRVTAPSASHVLLDGRAYALGPEALVVGRVPPGTANAIALPEGLAGVSRRHCTFLRDGGELVLIDHSTFGTFVNGERVAERVRVHAGDRVRIGDPGVELALIAVGDASPDAAHRAV